MKAPVSDLRAALEAGLASRYTIERELGRGGMATVYLAQDLRHDRPVALKVLHPDLAHALGPERFQREIRLAARLQHPHILTVHDSGEAAGRLWFTMPFIEGESLRERLDREKQLPVDDALSIARQAADALEYAHRHGVIHRDIKPENILLQGAHALVADFGIARSLSGPADDHLTSTGISIGTAAYMSPEQAAGEKDIDARSDIYSLGTVLYEMLAGETPFTAATAQAMVARRFTETARPVRSVRDSVPPEIENALSKALARTPADRFGSAGAFAAALVSAVPTVPTRRRVSPALAMLGLGFVLGLGILFAWTTREPADAPSGTRLVAVLPFENLGDSSDAYFADGIADEVRNKLAAVPGVEVIARGSSTPYRGTRLTPAQIADELGVRWLLTGTVRRVQAGGRDQVMVRPELVEIAGGQAPKTKWGESIDASLSDVFKVQADIAGQVVQALGVAFGAEAREHVAERPTRNLAAYDAYLRGEAISNGLLANDAATLRRAADQYAKAVALDPQFVAAWSRLSGAASFAYYNGTPTPEGAATALDAARRALALAPERPEGFVAMGRYLGIVRRDLAGEATQYGAGLRLAPADADLLASAGLNAQARGHWDSSLVFLRRGANLNPRSPLSARRLASTLLWTRRHDEAEAASERGRTLAPEDLNLLQVQAMVELARGDLAAARARLASAPETLSPADIVAYMATYFDLTWLLDSVQTGLLLRLGPAAFDDDRASRALVFADVYRLRGDARRAAAHADTAAREFEGQLAVTPDDPQLHVLRGLALAMAGRKAEAIGEGERALVLAPVSANASFGPYYQHQVVRIHIMVGEPEKALDLLEPLLRIPYYLTPGWLRIDPAFAPLRGNPRFERLIQGA
jgi:TolB-like protein